MNSGNNASAWRFETAAVIVAHPDDETLWAGGTILMHPETHWTIITICRAADTDRAPKFQKALKRFHARGAMADLDDGPEQHPLHPDRLYKTILGLLPNRRYDLILTHSLRGEYTRHLRHEETGQAVMKLWRKGLLRMHQLWMFAYEDLGRTILPRPIAAADRRIVLPEQVCKFKYDLVTRTYGFAADSWEARATPREEAFWCFDSPWHIESVLEERTGSESPRAV